MKEFKLILKYFEPLNYLSNNFLILLMFLNYYLISQEDTLFKNKNFEKVKLKDTQSEIGKDTLKKINNFIKYHQISVNIFYSGFKIPYPGFYSNGQLFALNSKGTLLCYFTNFKKYPNWFLGITSGYEQYNMFFYDFITPPKRTDDDWLNRRKNALTNLMHFVDRNISYINVHDSMRIYFGERIYNFDFIRLGYLLGYKKQITKNFSMDFILESSFLLNKEIFGGYSNNYWPIIFKPSNEICLFLFPFYPIMNIFERYNADDIYNGLVRYILNFNYLFSNRHSISFTISWANFYQTYYLKSKPKYIENYNANNGCLGCPYSAYKPFYFEMNVYPNIYTRFMFSLGYHFILESKLASKNYKICEE